MCLVDPTSSSSDGYEGQNEGQTAVLVLKEPLTRSSNFKHNVLCPFLRHCNNFDFRWAFESLGRLLLKTRKFFKENVQKPMKKPLPIGA